MATSANWQSFSLQIPGKDFLEGIRNILEVLLIFLEILKALLEVVKMLLILFGNPLKAIIAALVALVNTLFNALKQTGLYAWFDVPNPLVDPNFNRIYGGYQAFTNRFKASLIDVRDPNRPQPNSFNEAGFLLMAVDAEGVEGVLKLLKTLLRFFGKSFLSPQYGAPANVKALPVGAKGDPILSIVKIFQEAPKALVVEWALPSTQNVGDPGFSDVFSSFSTEFIPPQFLVEKSILNPALEIDAGDLGNPAAAGVVTTTVETNFEIRGQVGKPVKTKIRLKDEYGDPLVKFQKYYAITPSENSATFFLGQLGTFRFIDNDVQVGQTVYYRVRAYSGALDISGTSITFPAPTQDAITKQWEVRWPASDPAAPPVMGRASGTVSSHVPDIPPNFDVIENLKRLFQLAFSLNFHEALPVGAKFGSNGLPADDTTPTSDIGLGSLTQQAGSLVSFSSIPILGAAASLGAVNQNFAAFSPDPVTGKLPQAPWQTYRVRANSTRLASDVAGAMLSAGNAGAFKTLMEGTLPNGLLSGGLLGDTTLSTVCFHLTTVDNDPNVMRGILTLYGDHFADPKLRLNILSAVNFVKAFTLGGAPPDWVKISILRDIIPWSGQILYEILAKIQALLDALKGIFDQIIAFINLIERKIDALEKFIKYLISILDFLLSLQIGFYLLFVPQIAGPVTGWFSAIDNAGGTKPPSGPGGYTAGIGLAYVAPTVAPLAAALKLIF